MDNSLRDIIMEKCSTDVEDDNFVKNVIKRGDELKRKGNKVLELRFFNSKKCIIFYREA